MNALRQSGCSPVALAILAVILMNGAFLVEIGDLWIRLVGAIATLGAVGLAVSWNERRSLFSARRSSIALGLGSAVALYVAAAVIARIELVAPQAAVMNRWSSDYSTPAVIATVVIAVAGEEIFWRAAFLRHVANGGVVVVTALLAALVFSLAHATAGTWLLPLAALGCGFVWNLLYLTTGNLTASFVSHLVWDLLVVVVAPLG